MRSTSERGQVLVIGGFAMVVLLGIAALVIDLGFSWMLRRAEQNAVDPAAIAAARYLPSGSASDRYQAACFFVQQHGFFTDNNATCAAARATGDLYVGVPASGPYAGQDGYVEVRIRAEHGSFFGSIFGVDSMTVTTGAVAANVDGGTSFNSLVALDPSSCSAGEITGNGTVKLGGHVYVNSDGSGPPSCTGTFDNACSGTTGAFAFGGTNARLETPHLYVRGTCAKNANPYPGNCTNQGCRLTEGAPPITDPLAALPEPNHADYTERGGRTSCPGPGRLITGTVGCVFEGNSGYPATLQPGVYYGGWVIRGQARLRLQPGIYYFAGGGIQMSGSPNNQLESVDGAGGIGSVLLFSTGDPTYTGSCAQDPQFPPPPSVAAVQLARPDGFSASNGTWSGSYTSINEVTANDSNFLGSPSGPTTAHFYEVTLPDVDTPAATTGISVRYRYAKSGNNSGQTVNLKIELRQGNRVVASKTHTTIPGVTGGGWQAGSFTLTSAEAASITDWTDLRLRIDPSSSGSPARVAQVSWAEVEVPPGTSAAGNRRCQGKIEITGGNLLKLKATTIAPWEGMVMWQDGTLTGNGRGNNPVAKVDIGGQGGMNISGTIYAPAAKVYLRGNGSSDPTSATAGVQIIAWQFSIVGNGTLNMPFDPQQVSGSQQKGLVH